MGSLWVSFGLPWVPLPPLLPHNCPYGVSVGISQFLWGAVGPYGVFVGRGAPWPYNIPHRYTAELARAYLAVRLERDHAAVGRALREVRTLWGLMGSLWG